MNREAAVSSVEKVPGDVTKRWIDRHHEVAAPATHIYDFVWELTGDAIGPFCTDVDGNVFLDFASHIAASPLGYNNPKILEPMAEFNLKDPLKMTGQNMYVRTTPSDEGLPGPTELMERLVALTEHYDMDSVFLSNSGAEAIENAMKICYGRGRSKGITFEGAFHGRTLGALGLNRSKRIHRAEFPELPGIISAPYCSCDGGCHCGWKTNGPGGNIIADKLDAEQGTIDPSEIAFLVLEPIQGEGGYCVPNKEFIRDVTAIQREYDIKIIADEIQTGLGRTGEMWASDHFDLEPDVITSAKALRVGATISRTDVFPEKQGRLSSTWGSGDIVAAIQGSLTIDAISEHNLLTNATQRGRQARETIDAANLDCVVESRGLGLMIALEFKNKERRNDVIEASLQRGLLSLGCGHKTLRLLPPLDVTEREIELGTNILLDSIRATE